MDFPAGALTNFRVLDGFFHIFWRIYSRVAPKSRGSQFDPLESSGLRNSNEVRSALLALRNDGCYVSQLANRSELWIFSPNPNFEALVQDSGNGKSDEDLIVAGKATFLNVASGVNTAAEVKHRLLSDPDSSIFESAATQNKLTTNCSEYAQLKSLTTYSAFYEGFISAISKALTLHFTKQQKVIPLGTRTLYSSLEENGYQSGDDDLPFSRKSTSFLSILDINVTSKGRLAISLCTLPQPGLEQLLRDSESEIIGARLSDDVWIAPSGTLCRLTSTGEYQSTQSNTVSPGHIATTPHEVEPLASKTKADKREWKRCVAEWLRIFGLQLNDPEAELWVEVEVNALDRQLYILFSKSNWNHQKSSPFIRILWPLKLCFTRSRSKMTAPANPTGFFSGQAESPLHLAERWVKEPCPIRQPFDKHKTSDDPSELEKQQQKCSEPSPLKLDHPEMPESLARVINLPEAQLASAVYPTPPGGGLAQGMGAGIVSEGLGTSAIDTLNYPPTQSEQIYNETVGPAAYFRGTSELLPTGLDPTTSELGIGSGLYDTAADEDFFGDMDVANFDTKGITEADFNFFDEPEFTGLTGDLDMQTGEPEAVPHDTEANFTAPDSSDTAMSITEPSPSNNDQNHLTKSEHDTIKQPAFSSLITTGDEDHICKETTELSQIISTDDSQKKRPISPPLSPVQIKKILSPDVSTNLRLTPFKSDISRLRVAPNQYSPVIFQPRLCSSDQKYKIDGKFWFTPGKRYITSNLGGSPSGIPTIGFPEKGRKVRPKPLPILTSLHPLISDNTLEIELQSPSTSSSGSSEGNSDTDHESNASSSHVMNFHPKRNRDYEVEGNSTPSPLDILTQTSDLDKGPLSEHQFALLGAFLSEGVDWPLTGYFSRKQNDIFPVFLRREDLLQTAQLVVDQITQSSFCHIRDDLHKPEWADWDDILSRSLFDNIDGLGHLSKLDLRTYVTLEDGSNPRKDGPSIRSNLTGSICKICPPHIKVHRGNSYLEILPSAIGFWETFGLEPLQGEKDIIPFCIYPPNVIEAAEAFIERLGLVYSSGNFGSHSRPNKANGLVPWSLNAASDQNYASLMHALNVSCENLGSSLSNLSATDKNVVIYIINPFIYDAAIVDICSAFLRLFHKYVGDIDRQHTRHLSELVLQIIPLEFIASADSLVVPTQTDYLRLALEVYSRCPPKDRSSDWLGCSPPLVLADPVPKVVPFRLAAESVAPLEEAKSLHVAYSQSVDQRWVTAAWTDNSGRHQSALSYCLRERDSSVSRPISEIRTQIWETSKDIMDMSLSHWRLIVVKDEPVDLEEVEMWTSLLDQYNRTKAIKVELGIISVNTKPGLSLKLPSSPLQPSALSQQAAQNGPSTTPGSTPRPVPSPDPSGPAATPPTANAPTYTDQHTPPQHAQQSSPDSDQDTILIDKSDETWGVTLSHRLNNSYYLTKHQPALASGYLFRRSGVSDTDGQAIMAVNIIYTNSRRPIDHLLKDILRMYRELITLARVRGIVHAQGNSPLPWHIMTAIKGQEMLCYTL
ncbi:conserved hypothetical protein [Histoplasma capsulatum G186AR]|uniref:Mediator of RNA polymerase II transcription subunit 13 n=2 Tax=Ajellomyces capsulatus TaxID=5037 RepID=C0NS34_AJECG|nr:uncharacterized protein HCBG_05964 [Histoplasma capsulatum G186AR]EEH05700.1 conserved hypothetical protein [Histoplasma capsulatum G186AR]KAG5300142.1 hypothetical protein I7I52_10684 [Histoplasma capsulatum]QSS67229.1 hypothetical protein I7I50_06243 [Histoplasma capsulatum G186AR]